MLAWKQMAASAFILALLVNARAEVNSVPSPVPSVDLSRYVGRWYEIAAIPQWFQKKCVGQVQAEYSNAEDTLIKVLNTCMQADGSVSTAEGRAKVEDPVSHAKLKVTFVKIVNWIFTFGGDYWVIDLAQDYHYAVVGHPTRDYGWILSRTPSLDMNELREIESRLVEQGYDSCKLLTTVQTGGFSEKKPLCEVLKLTN